MRERDLDQLQDLLGHRFSDLDLLKQALCHRSYANEHPDLEDNERLEFLGDAVLELVVSDVLYRSCPEDREGELSRRRAALVNTSSLAQVAQNIGLGEALLLGRGERASGGETKERLLANGLEAIFGALHVSGGSEAVTEAFFRLFDACLRQTVKREQLADYKSLLQERLQAAGFPPPSYQVTSEEGPDHARSYVVIARSEHADLQAQGAGSSKKKAQQLAARALLELLETVAR